MKTRRQHISKTAANRPATSNSPERTDNTKPIPRVFAQSPRISGQELLAELVGDVHALREAGHYRMPDLLDRAADACEAPAMTISRYLKLKHMPNEGLAREMIRACRRAYKECCAIFLETVDGYNTLEHYQWLLHDMLKRICSFADRVATPGCGVDSESSLRGPIIVGDFLERARKKAQEWEVVAADLAFRGAIALIGDASRSKCSDLATKTSRVGARPAPDCGLKGLALDTREQRNQAVDRFIDQCNELSVSALSSYTVRRKHIWMSIGHKQDRQFQYWVACDARATNADEKNFTRILTMPAQQFIDELITRKLL
jgi:hypothetical protein